MSANPFDKYLTSLPKELRDSVRSATTANDKLLGDTAAVITVYLRNSGDDKNDGLTAGTAVGTIEEAFRRLTSEPRPSGPGRRILDMTGFTETDANKTLYLDFGNGGSYKDKFVFTRPNYTDQWDILDFPFEIRANTTLVTALTIVGTPTTDPTSQLATVTVSETMVPNEHVGRIFHIDGELFPAQVHSNTANTLKVTTTGGASWSGTAGVYDRSCVLDYDEVRISSTCPVAFYGIDFRTASGNAIRSNFSIDIYFYSCAFQGLYCNTGSSILHTSDCYFNGREANLECSVSIFSCLFLGTNLNAHGAGGAGLNFMQGSIFDGCTAIGEGNRESDVDIQVTNCEILNGSSHGVVRRSPIGGALRNVLISGCSGNAISIEAGGATFKIDTVTGTGNSGYGLLLADGSQAWNVGGNTVTGTLGEVKVGASAVSLWSGTERTDVGEALPQFCRIL